MIETYGLTHIALAVRDLDRSLGFYQAVFGMLEVYRGEDFVQAQTPGSRDVIVFKKDTANAGRAGGVIHFGFRLIDPAAIDKAARTWNGREAGSGAAASFVRASRFFSWPTRMVTKWRSGTNCPPK